MDVNPYSDASVFEKQTRCLPIMVFLTDREYEYLKHFYPEGVLYLQIDRKVIDGESDHDTNFGDFIRWLFKLAPSCNDLPIEIIVKRKE